jgi:hypothetical protein
MILFPQLPMFAAAQLTPVYLAYAYRDSVDLFAVDPAGVCKMLGQQVRQIGYISDDGNIVLEFGRVYISMPFDGEATEADGPTLMSKACSLHAVAVGAA